MKKFVLLALLLIVVVAGALVYHTLAKPAPKAADLLPESTLLFVDVPDFSKSRAEFQKTAIYALWHEPELQAFLEKPRQALREAFGQSAGTKDDKDWTGSLLDALQGEAFVAVTHVTLIPSMQAGVVLGVDVKHKRLEAKAVLYKLERRAKAQHPGATFATHDHLGVRYSVWEIRPGYPVCRASLNSLFVFTLGEDTMRDVIARFKQQSQTPSPSLSANSKYREVVSHMPAGYEGLLFFNVDQVMELAGPFMMVPQVASTLQKLARIRAVGNSVTFMDGGVQDVGFVAFNKDTAPKPTPPATQRKSLAFTSPQTLLYAVQSADLAAGYDDIMQSLTQVGNTNVTGAAMQFERTLRRQNIRMRDDVLANLGPETALIASWRTGARVPDAAFVAEIRGTPGIQPALTNALNAIKEAALGDDTEAPWQESEHLGQTLHSVNIGAGIVSPTYVITDKFFVLGLTPDYVRELLSQMHDSKPTLAASADYEKAMQRLPANGNGYTFCNLPGVFEPLYGLAQSGLAAMGTNAILEANKLPKVETITKHLFPYSAASVADEKSSTTTSFSPIDKPMVLAIGIAGAIVAQPYIAPKGWVGSN